MTSQKRKDYISWEYYFMEIAKLSARRSKDPNTQVGACIVNCDNKIVGIGYNGLPKGCSDDLFPWGNDNKDIPLTKYPYVVHAEANAIINASLKVSGARIYTTLFPCNECMKLLIQSGIKEVIYLSDKYSTSDMTKASKKMALASGIILKKYEED